MIEKIGIIADDFTGANDTGVQLAKKGYSSSVRLTKQEQLAEQQETDAWIVDTDSRSVSSETAYKRVFEEAEELKQKGIRHFYKKMDSTLRGNVGVELQAMEQAVEAELLVIAPAFPKLGRTTVNGCHYVEGRLIAETEFAKDPKTPVLHSYIPDLLLPEGEGKTVVVTREVLDNPQAAQWTAERLNEGRNWFVCDAASEEDLAKIVKLFQLDGKRIVWAGSAGLMDHLAFGTADSRGKAEIKPQAGKILTVSGSLSERTSKQLAALAERPATIMVEVDPMALVKKEAEIAGILEKTVRNGEWDTIVLFVASSVENRTVIRQYAAEQGFTMEEAAKAISEGLGSLSKKIMAHIQIDALIMTGGDTAKDICSILEAPEMELLHEVEPGLPLGFLSLPGRKIWAVTKAGGFGSPASLVKAVDFLKGENTEYESV